MSSLGKTPQTSGWSFNNSALLSSWVLFKSSTQASLANPGLCCGYFCQKSSREWKTGFESAMLFLITTSSLMASSSSGMTVKSELALRTCWQSGICMLRELKLRKTLNIFPQKILWICCLFTSENEAAKRYQTEAKSKQIPKKSSKYSTFRNRNLKTQR